MNAGGGNDADSRKSLARLVREAVLEQISDEALEHLWELLTARLRRSSGHEDVAPPADAILTPTQAAMLAGVSVATIRNWQNAGFLGKQHLGRVSRLQLLEYLAGGKMDADKEGKGSADAWAASVYEERQKRRGHG